MATVTCPHCGAEVKLDKQSLGIFFADVSSGAICPHCDEEFDLPPEVRRKLQMCRVIDDLARLDFLSDGMIDGPL